MIFDWPVIFYSMIFCFRSDRNSAAGILVYIDCIKSLSQTHHG
jgi:hypothetical protein